VIFHPVNIEVADHGDTPDGCIIIWLLEGVTVTDIPFPITSIIGYLDRRAGVEAEEMACFPVNLINFVPKSTKAGNDVL
jgi:hypothetical protein